MRGDNRSWLEQGARFAVASALQLTGGPSHGSRCAALAAWGANPDHPSDSAVLALRRDTMTMVLNESGGDVAIVAAEESNKSSVSWGAVIAGAVAAAAVSLLLMLLGSGLGLAVISPWSVGTASLTTIAASALIWLVIVHWVGSAVGGYIAGRLRTGWTGVHRDEVTFRDTAHGFLTWGISVLLVAVMSGLAASTVLFAGVQA